MSDYLDKIITKKKDGTQVASVLLQDADAQTRLGTVEGKISTALTPINGNPISISGLKSTQLAVEPVITFEPIQAGSGTPSPENIRPISGYDKIEVLSQSKNLYADGNVSISNTAYVKVSLSQPIPAGTYKVSAILSNTTSSDARVSFRRSDETGIVSVDVIYNASGRSSSNDILISDTTYVLYFYYTSPGVSGSRTWTDIMIAPSNFDTVYQPYHKTTSISESLRQTVYGGTLDVRTGKFTVDRAIYEFSGSETPIAYGNGYRYVVLTKLAKSCDADDVPNVISNQYSAVSRNSITQSVIGISVTNDTVLLSTDNPTGVKLVYELATPFTLQLTPHEISLLKDYAYVSTNGTNIQFDYHNGELASLADVSQLGETVNELGAKVLSFVRLSYSFGTVINGTRYTFEVTNNYSYLNRNTVKAITIYSVKGSSGADAEGIYNQNFGIGDPNKLFINYNCKMSQSNAVMEVDILYLA